MNVYLVVNQRRDWPHDVPGTTVVPARDYLTGAAYAAGEPARVFNLCRNDRYQGRGYYVSLLAEARGHEPMPTVRTIEDVQAGLAPDLMTGEGEDPAPWPLEAAGDERVELDAWFGRDPEGRHDAVARELFARLKAPMLHAAFVRRDGRWHLESVRLVTPREVPEERRGALAQAAADHLAPPRPRSPGPRPALAILHNADAPDPPSNPAALERIVATAKAMGMRAEIIGRGDIDRLPDFDALFIRDTTHVNHYPYQFARRAAAEGLVVIDDPDSILKCTNKVYLNELFARHQVPVPRTLVVERDSVDQVAATLGFPCIVKLPDSAFSLGVTKVNDADALATVLDTYFARSELVVAQEWLPTAFDWRVGVLDGRPLYVCKYLMAPGHWQVVKREPGRKLEGATVALPVGEAPEVVVRTAVRAAGLIGDGLYGVDLKQAGERCCVIEINDNPNLDAGNEDGVLGDALYRELLGVFLRRVRERGRMAAD
jgi:glutathione synthase/RimK-type ligase-like ATP-grasp enzyme